MSADKHTLCASKHHWHIEHALDFPLVVTDLLTEADEILRGGATNA